MKWLVDLVQSVEQTNYVDRPKPFPYNLTNHVTTTTPPYRVAVYVTSCVLQDADYL